MLLLGTKKLDFMDLMMSTSTLSLMNLLQIMALIEEKSTSMN